MSSTAIVLERASLLCYRLYDIADELRLDEARRLLTDKTRPLRLSREGSQYVQLPRPPLGFELGRRIVPLRDGGQVEADVFVRVFDFGTASVQLKVPVPPGTQVEALIPLADDLFDSKGVDAVCLEVVEGVRSRLAPAIEGSHLWAQNESYTVLFAEAIAGRPSAQDILQRADLARLLLGEAQVHNLSREEREAVTASHFSYTEEDLAVIDWNAAFVYEPSGSMDIPDLLEMANAQLVELRYYDELLDTRLQATYDEVQRKKRRWYSIFRSPYRKLARRTLATLLELQEFTERAENSLKVIGDTYLAKVYEAASKQFRIDAWQLTVTRKQDVLARTHQLLKGEVDTDRSITLETTIVLLIVFEILMAFFQVLK